MKPWQGALLGGAIGSAVVIGIAAWRKVGEVQDWASALQAAAAGDAQAQTELQAYAGELKQRMTAVATERTEVIAQQAADATMGTYGLSPARMEQLQVLAASFGV